MIQSFNVTQIKILEKEAKIILYFSLDIDEDTVDTETVFVSEVSPKEALNSESENNDDMTWPATITKPIIKTTLTVDGKILVIELPEMKVNTYYEIIVTTNVKSIIDSPLVTKFRRRIKIDSIVDSEIEIVSPANFEDIQKNLLVQVKEKFGKSKRLFNKYEIQIASEVGFYDILHTTKITEKSQIDIKALKPSEQYYIRARAIDDNGSYGNWSKKITFTFNKNCQCQTQTEDEDSPAFIQDLHIVGTSDQGTTPDKFIIVFDKDIDPSSIDINKFILLRKQV